jgi:hypothetical protein
MAGGDRPIRLTGGENPVGNGGSSIRGRRGTDLKGETESGAYRRSFSMATAVGADELTVAGQRGGRRCRGCDRRAPRG